MNNINVNKDVKIDSQIYLEFDLGRRVLNLDLSQNMTLSQNMKYGSGRLYYPLLLYIIRNFYGDIIRNVYCYI